MLLATDIPELREAGGEDAIYTPPTLEPNDGILKALPSDRPRTLNCTDHSWAKSTAVFARVLADNADVPLAEST
jgi:hypothetical protein